MLATIPDEIDEQLMSLAKINTCPERKKYVCILIDEMHIKADLVYDKHTGTSDVRMYKQPWVILS